MKRLVSFVLAFLLFPSIMVAQATGTGAYAFASFDHPGFESVNLGNANVRFTIPILNRQGRGLNFNYVLQYEGLVWSAVNGVWVADPSWGFQGELNGAGFSGYLSHVESRAKCPAPWGNKGAYDATLSSFVYHDAFGGQHAFNYKEDEHSCPDDLGDPAITGNGASNDGSGYTLVDSTAVRTRNGTIIAPASGPVGLSPTSTTDRNGNQIVSSGSGSFTDTLGGTALTVSGSSPLAFTYPVPQQPSGATTASTVLSYRTYTVRTNFGCSGIVEYGSTSVSLPDRLTFADGSYYAFTYEGTYQATDGAVTGRLASVRLPTGGTISYGYTGGCNGGGAYPDGTPSVLTRTTSDGTRTYNRGANGSIPFTAVVNEAGDETDYNFLRGGANYQFWYESDHWVNKGTGPGRTTLMERQTCYNMATAPCDSQNFALPITTVATSVIYDGVASPVTTSTYDTAGNLQTTSNSFGTTTNQYNSNGDLSGVSVRDPGSNLISQTTYGYDETGVTSTGSLPGRSSPAASRGNVTSTHVWTGSGSSTLDTTAAYYDTGQRISSTSSTGTTQYQYDSATQAFLAKTILPTVGGVSLSSEASYDATDAVLTGAKGLNNAWTTASHYDPMLRPTTVTPPTASGVVNVTYPALSGATPNTTDIQQDMGGRTAEQQMLTDTYGRTMRTALRNDSGWYLTDTCYNAVGLVAAQTVPYSSASVPASAPNCSQPSNTFTYDALGRVLTVTGADGYLRKTNVYQGFSTKTTTDVNGPVKVTSTDMAGRLAAVCEVSSGTNISQSETPSSCGGPFASLNGYWTTYVYDDANHKTSITQGLAAPHQQQRIFQTDAVGRTTYVKEPESGETHYTYTYNSTGLQVIRTKPRANQHNGMDLSTNASVSAMTNTTTQYDLLGRVRDITYDDGTPSKHFDYDQSGTSFNFANAGGKLTTATSGANTAAWQMTEFTYDNAGNVTHTLQCFPAKCGNGSFDAVLTYSYDVGGHRYQDAFYNNGNGNSDGIGRSFSLAGEVNAVTAVGADLTGSANNNGDVITSATQGPFGPTVVNLGNGLTRVDAYLSGGTHWGTWVCSGSSSSFCGGHPTLYGGGFLPSTNNISRFAGIVDTVIGQNSIHVDLAYDDLSRLIGVSFPDINTGYTMSYDQYGNRWSQAAMPGTSGAVTQQNFSIDQTTNRIATLQYDDAGNQYSDGIHSYRYDAEGNVVQVDSGSAEVDYSYDALNHRTRILTASGSNTLYGFDLDGHRLTTWDGSGSGTVLQAVNAYFNGELAATFRNSQIYYQHMDPIGTHRLTTDHTGATVATFKSFPFGDAYQATGTTTDQAGFAQQDHDTATNTEHAQFRQYHSTQGRWMSPDPYSGSYRPRNPQSFNRYAYALNNPLLFIDPSGLAAGLGDCMFGGTHFDDASDSESCVPNGGRDTTYPGDSGPGGGAAGSGHTFCYQQDAYVMGQYDSSDTFCDTTDGDGFDQTPVDAPNNPNKSCQAGPLNLSKNIKTAKQLAHTFWLGSPVAAYNAASQYVRLVQTGGPWDPKTTMGMTPGNVAAGNINFGATCSQFGGNTRLGGQVCQYGAGIYGKLSGVYGSSFFSPSHGDIPSDNQQIQQGLAIAKNGSC